MNKFDWDFHSSDELVDEIGRIVNQTVKQIIDTPSFTLERKYGEIVGAMNVFHKVSGAVLAYHLDKEKEEAEFKESCQQAGKAYEKLFGENPEWKKPENNKTEASHGTDT